MSGQWKQLLAGVEQNPGRADTVSGIICLCRTLQNPFEQARLLSECAVLVLATQPILGLQLLRLAVLLAPRDVRVLEIAKEIFKRRGRWAAEQQVTEFMATLSLTTAVSPTVQAVTQIATAHAVTVVAEPKPSPEQDYDVEHHWDWLETPPEESPTPGHNKTPQPQSDVLDDHSDLFAQFLRACGLSEEYQKYSAGFSSNQAGLVAFVNLLFNMNLIKETDKPAAIIQLFKMVTETDDSSGGHELFNKLFMQRDPRKGE